MGSQDLSAEIERLQEELRETRLAYQMAMEMSQFKAGFLARVSHELRSPLNGMIGMHQLILSDLCDDPAEEREFIGQAHASALKLLKLLDLILTVSKTEHGSIKMEIQPLSLASLLNEVYQLTYLQAQDRNLRFQLIPPDPEVYVLADPTRLRQVLVSLVDIPIHSMREGHLCLSTKLEPETGYVHIWIEDERPASFWQEPLALLQDPLSVEQSWSGQVSPGMTLLMNQTLLERMQGRLEILATPLETSSDASLPACLPSPGEIEPTNLSRVQCSIPLVMPDA